MTEISNTTAHEAGKLYFLNPERVAFQAVLDLFEKAMRAEAMLFLSGAPRDSDIGTALGDTVARAWADCDTALDTMLRMPDLSPVLRAVADRLQLLLPRLLTHDFNFQHHFMTLSNTSKKQRKIDHGLADQIMDAALIFHVCEANVRLSQLQRVTVADEASSS